MVNFLLMLGLAPVMWVGTCVYMSPLHRLNGYFWVKLIIKVALAVALLGGFGAQLNFLAHREPSLQARRFYLLALLIIEGIPMLAIMIYRNYQDPSSYGSNRSVRVNQSPKER